MENLLQIVDSAENNALHRAVGENNLEAVKFLVIRGVNTTITIQAGQTPLHIAVLNNNQDIMRELCKNKSRDEVRNLMSRRTVNTGSTALRVAVQNNSLESTRFLLARGANFEIQDNQHRRPEQLTTDKNIRELFEFIGELFKCLSSDYDDVQAPQDVMEFCSVENSAAVTYARDAQNRSMLQLAMERNYLNEVAAIINFRIEKLKQDDWQLGKNFDRLAQHSETVKLRLSDLYAFCHKNNDLAVRKNVVDLLREAHEFLQAYKVQTDRSLDNQPLLIVIEESLEFFGSWKGSKFVENQRVDSILGNSVVYVVRMLKVCIVAPMQLFMQLVYTTELLEAAKRNDPNKVEKCLTGNPDLNKEDADNHNALRYAFKNKNFEMAKLLLTLGADPTSEATQQNEPLLYFALRQIGESTWPVDARVMQLLFDRAGDDEKSINFVNACINVEGANDGATALHLAVRHSDRLMQFLLSKGAIYCVKNSCKRTPKDYCRSEEMRNRYYEMERLFEHARYGQTKELIQAMEQLDVFHLLAVGGARNELGQTLIQVIEAKGHVEEAEVIRNLLASEQCNRYKQSAVEFLCDGLEGVIRGPNFGIHFRRK